MTPSTQTDTETWKTDLTGFSEQSPLERLNAKFDALATKVSDKITETEGEMKAADKTWVTR